MGQGLCAEEPVGLRVTPPAEEPRHEGGHAEIHGSIDVEGGVLTSDNPHLSRLTNGPPDDPDSLSNEGGEGPVEDQTPPDSISIRAVDCTTAPDVVPDEVAALVEASIADNTRRAYRSDLDHFAAWGGTLPAEPAARGLLPRRARGDAQRRHPRPPHRDHLEGA